MICWFENKVWLGPSEQGYTLPHIDISSDQRSQKAIRQFLDGQGFDCEVCSLYSVYEYLDAHKFTTYYRANANNDKTNELGDYIDIDQIAALNFVSSDIQRMLQRFVLEKQNGVFRLYVGDNTIGNIN